MPIGNSPKRGETYCSIHSNSLSNKMDNSLLDVRDINHKYIIIVGGESNGDGRNCARKSIIL